MKGVVQLSGGTPWAQVVSLAWVTLPGLTTLPKVVTVLRAFATGKTGQERRIPGNDRV